MTSELIAILVLFLLSAIPLLRLSGGTRYVGVLILIGGAGVAMIIGLRIGQAEVTRTARERNTLQRPLQVLDDGFVSSRSCRACHPQQYATWHASYHRTRGKGVRNRFYVSWGDDKM